MKISAKILALAMALMMVFTFASCGKTDADRIIGNWEAEISFVKVMEASGATGVDVFDKVDDVKMTLEFNDKGVVQLEVDASDAVKSSSFKDAMLDYLLEQSGVTEADLEATGVDVDEYIDEAIDTMGDQLAQKTTVKYEFDEDKLYMDDEKQDYEFKDDNTLVMDMEDFGEIEFKRD